MNAATIERIETNVERAASALLGGAVAYALYAALKNSCSLPQLGACCGGAALLVYMFCCRAMHEANKGDPDFRFSPFDVSELESFDCGELVLTDADRITNKELVLTDRVGVDELVLTDEARLPAPPLELVLTDADRLGATVPDQPDPLVLDDILAEIGPNSRVVRLFDRTAMPSAGELKSRIDDHLGQERSASAAPDASRELSEALARLRRSLR